MSVVTFVDMAVAILQQTINRVSKFSMTKDARFYTFR